MSRPKAIDLQVNGYGGVDFNSLGLTADALHSACEMLDAHGVEGILATITTEQPQVMSAHLRNLVSLRAADALAQRIIAGIHVEGPFLNEAPGFRGAHPPDAICLADVATMRGLLEAAGGLTKLVTLAPERDPGFRVTRFLSELGVIVSAGHTDATLAQLQSAIEAGLTMFTHLGNGCPMQMHRHDNIIQRALSLSDQIWLCVIPDGIHVPWPALRNYVRAAGVERVIAVTDCIAAAGMGPGHYRLGRFDLQIGDDRVARSPDGSHFVGSTVTMPEVVRNLRDHLNLGDAEVEQLVASNPRRAMRM